MKLYEWNEMFEYDVHEEVVRVTTHTVYRNTQAFRGIWCSHELRTNIGGTWSCRRVDYRERQYSGLKVVVHDMAMLYITITELHLMALRPPLSCSTPLLVAAPSLMLMHTQTPSNALVGLMIVVIMPSLIMLRQLSLASNVCYTWVLAKLFTLALSSLSIGTSF